MLNGQERVTIAFCDSSGERGMNQLKWTLVIVFLLSFAAGCRQQAQTSASSLQIDLQVAPTTPAVGDASLQVTVKDANGQPVNDAKVSARGDMSHAGMVPVIQEVQGGTNGVYDIPFQWSMAGDWTVEVTVTLASGDTTSKTFDYSVAGAAMNMESTDEADMGSMDQMQPTPTIELAE